MGVDDSSDNLIRFAFGTVRFLFAFIFASSAASFSTYGLIVSSVRVTPPLVAPLARLVMGVFLSMVTFRK